MAQERFDTSEAEAVLMEAARRQARAVGSATSVSRDRLEAMAAELDIPPETLHEVLAEREAGASEAALRAAFIAERRGTILPHLVPYLSICAMLFFIWLASGGGSPWFIFPVMGWGIGMASHVAAVYPASGAAFEAGLEEYKKKVERRERDRARRTAKRAEKVSAKEQKSGTVTLPEENSPQKSTSSWGASEEPQTQVLRAGRKG
ncbi:MAG: 2TM domain-containing protein [Akkermansiaceae bacterium]|nr:2TM domain-containing protein [Armatimonadota bacterium]